MGKTVKNPSYRKLKKLERSKIKIKSSKDHLPKGQNITDTNFKVKKIIIKDQVTQHKEGDILSKNKLSLQELIKHLNQRNAKAKLDALAGLKDIISQFPCETIKLHFHVLFKKIPPLILDESKDVRRETNKLLRTIITQSDNLKSFYSILHAHMICGLTHINRVVREDGLYFLGTLIEHAGLLCVDSVPEILPILLNQISRGDATKRTLITHLEAKYVSDTWREKVINKISALLSLVHKHYKDQYKEPEPPKELKIEELPIVNGIRYIDPPIRLSRIDLTNRFDLFNKTNSLTPYQQQQFDMKEFASSLIPLLFELTVEHCPVEKDYLNDNETSADITSDVSVVLKDIVNIIYFLWSILTEPKACQSGNPSQISCWFKNKFGKAFMKTLIKSRFPYSIVSTEKGTCYFQNIFLMKLALILTDMKEWNVAVSYFKNILRTSDKFIYEEWKLYISCFELIIDSRSDHTDSFLSILQRLTKNSNQFVSSRATEVLYKIALDDRLTYVRSMPSFIIWLDSLPGKLLKSSITEKDIVMILDLARRHIPAFSVSLDGSIEAILDNLPNISIDSCVYWDERRNREKITNLLCQIKDWDDNMKINLNRGIKNNYWGTSLTNKIKYIIVARYGEDFLAVPEFMESEEIINSNV